MTKLTSISNLSKLLNLTNIKSKKPSNHVLRYWEKEFKQIKPTILKNRRYYSEKQINIIKLIKKQSRKQFKIILTGGLSHLFKNAIKGKSVIEKDLTIEGLKKVIIKLNK